MEGMYFPWLIRAGDRFLPLEKPLPAVSIENFCLIKGEYIKMPPSQEGNQAMVPKTGTMKRTLNLTSLLVNAMALIAPGAFLWTTFQVQAAQTNGGVTTAGEMWTGLLAALVLAFLTAISYAELANIYPKAGAGSSYYYAEASFLEKEKAEHRKWARIVKFLVGWISHLYYWIYPGIMVAFSAILIVYIFGLFGIALSGPEQILVAIIFAVPTAILLTAGSPVRP